MRFVLTSLRDRSFASVGHRRETRNSLSMSQQLRVFPVSRCVLLTAGITSQN